MKKNELAVIILVVAATLGVTYAIANALFGKTNNQKVTVPVVEAITSEVTEPSESIFNKDAINPTVQINIGDDGKDEQPF